MWTTVVALVLATGLLAGPAVAGDPPISMPASPQGLRAPVALPDELDPASPYLPQASCSPVDTPGVTKLRNLVMATYGQGWSGSISRGCTEGLSEHSEGRAWDWMIDPKDKRQKAAAADFIAWVTRDGGRNARRLGIMYVIYDKKIWGVYNLKGGWRASQGHEDHVHVSLSWNGARGNVSFWTGKVSPIDYGPCVRFKGTYGARTGTPRTTACPAISPLLVRTTLGTRQFGRTGATVKKAQALLKVSRTGRFDTRTWAAVRRYQRAHDIPYTGVLDQPTWASLSPSSVKSRTVKSYTRASAIAHGVKHYGGSTIRKGQVGKAVLILQRALGLRRADRNGFYDAVTLAAVKKVQGRAGMGRDGLVRAAEWQAMAKALN
ncbi:peptidoglycan-binding domain-containing protein [Aeromicrobium chenweiae]|uniref:peptidoglycan-binding domain-containing protein n=1 Tax=Aeromicrobium chenweiae TaxID=2079793 RepID=UPI0010931AD6|nr:peptidoglycan-binding protein [Aeromicrobium chenweiae]TGN31653.1 hypothetical protein E4L97_11750 [Aeromicrobium chenweiae]